MNYTCLLIALFIGMSPIMAKDAPVKHGPHHELDALRIELNLSSEQQEKIQSILQNDPLIDAERQIHQANQRNKMDGAIMSILTADQQTQFQKMKMRRQEERRIYLKTRALTMLDRSLDLTDTQFQKIGVVLDQYHANLTLRTNPSPSPESLMVQLKKNREDRDRAIRAILTPAQQKKWTYLQTHLLDNAPHSNQPRNHWRRNRDHQKPGAHPTCPHHQAVHHKHHERG